MNPWFSRLVLSVGMVTSPAFAGSVSVTLSGTAADGGPAFEVAIGSEVVGKATVDPIPANGGVSTFSFDVSDNILNSGGDFAIRLTNDFSNGADDRNLFVFGASVGDIEIKSSDMQIMVGEASEERDSTPFLGIWTSGEIARASPPKEGWLGPLESQCKPRTAVIEGFNIHSVVLGKWGKRKLREVVSEAKARRCSVAVLGYQSIEEPEGQKIERSKLRAHAVLDYLVAQGAKFKSKYVEGFGVTSEFGNPAANRRVVVEIKN